MRVGKLIPYDRRFWALVEKRAENECWNWQGAVGPRGYGSFVIFERKQMLAHRISWTLAHDFDPPPPGKVVMHTCDNRLCVNPAHLVVGTVAENQTDMARKWRSRSKLTPEEVEEIRASDESYRVLAQRYGLKSHKSVANIKARRTFGHLA